MTRAPEFGPTDEESIALAQQLLLARQLRGQFFPGSLGKSEAWALILAVYLARQEGRIIRVTPACEAARLPLATGLAWIKRLEAAGLMQRSGSEADGRHSLLTLSDEAAERVEGLLAAVARGAPR